MSKLVEVFYASASPRYENNEFYVYRHPRQRNKFFVDIDGGCSCYYYEVPTLEYAESQTPLGKREVYAEFSKWWDAYARYQSGTKIDNMQRLRSSL